MPRPAMIAIKPVISRNRRRGHVPVQHLCVLCVLCGYENKSV